MKKVTVLAFIPLFLSLIFYLAQARTAKVTLTKEESTCYECHEEIKSLKVGNNHGMLQCTRCHGKLSEHLNNPEQIPETNLGLSLCGQCHRSQYETFVSVNLKSKAKVEKATTTSRSPIPTKVRSYEKTESKEENAPLKKGGSFGKL